MLELQNIHKRFSGFTLTVPSLTVQENIHFVLLGPTGAGKTLLLNIMAGIVSPDQGRVRAGGADITRLPPEKRRFGVVYQDSALFPHLSVEENVAFPLRVRRTDRSEVIRLTDDMMSRIGITHLAGRGVTGLSGGEKQRVALARALITNPLVLLLDEPFNSLDYISREAMMSLLKEIRRLQNPTIIHITHDFEEALALADQVGIIKNGIIEQTGTTSEVFRSPGNSFVANFVGARNIYPGAVIGSGDNTRFSIDGGKTLFIGRDVDSDVRYAMVRAEDIIISRTEQQSSATNSFRGTVVDITRKRGINEIVVDFGITIHSYITNRSLESLAIKLHDEVYVIFKGSAVHLF